MVVSVCIFEVIRPGNRVEFLRHSDEFHRTDTKDFVMPASLVMRRVKFIRIRTYHSSRNEEET